MTRIGEIAMLIELTAHTGAGARRVAIAEELSPQLAARAAEHDRDGSYPFEAIDALKAVGYLPRPSPSTSVGSGVVRRPRRRVKPPGAWRRICGDRREHDLVAVLNMERRRQVAVAAGAERRAGLRLLARADRSGRRGAGRHDQSARAGPHAAGHARVPHRVRVADRRPEDVRHDVARRHRSVRGRHLCRRRGHRALCVRNGSD